MSEAGAGVFVFLLGLLIVFFGMAIIVLVISLIGNVMKRSAEKKKTENAPTAAPAVSENAEDDGAIVAAIIAAVTAFYAREGSPCEFKVKRIKRI